MNAVRFINGYLKLLLILSIFKSLTSILKALTKIETQHRLIYFFYERIDEVLP